MNNSSKWLTALTVSAVIFSGCSVKINATDNSHTQTIVKNDNSLLVQGTLFTAIYQQRAAEYKALCIQAYNLATWRLTQSLNQPRNKKKSAVVTDIDETVLDNSPAAVSQSLQGKGYDQKAWENWTSKALCDTLCGALGFFKYAAANNVEVFYVSNRSENERAGTLRNLQRYGFPFADNAHLILRADVSSKEKRRENIAKNYDILLLCGDNLTDFSAIYDRNKESERTQNVANNRTLFGEKYIVLPNSTYGDWLGSMYNYNYRLTPAQVDSTLLLKAKSY